MYGFIFYILAALTRLGAKIILFGQDTVKRIDASNKGKEVYTDHNGASRLTSTGQRFTASQQPNGHWIWTDDHFNIVKDVSQNHIEQCRKESYDFSVKHGCSTYIWMASTWGRATSTSTENIYKHDYASYFKDPADVKYHFPTLYKDIKTGEIYAIGILDCGWRSILKKYFGYDPKDYCRFVNKEYFVNPKTNEIIRAVDKEDRIGCSESLTQEEIEMINKLTLEKGKKFFYKYADHLDYWRIHEHEK